MSRHHSGSSNRRNRERSRSPIGRDRIETHVEEEEEDESYPRLPPLPAPVPPPPSNTQNGYNHPCPELPPLPVEEDIDGIGVSSDDDYTSSRRQRSESRNPPRHHPRPPAPPPSTRTRRTDEEEPDIIDIIDDDDEEDNRTNTVNRSRVAALREKGKRVNWDRERRKLAEEVREKERKEEMILKGAAVVAAGEGVATDKSQEELEMMALMGFSNFDSTKGKQVSGNDIFEVSVTKKRRYRQYMNRRGGFNRPLDYVP